MHLPIDAGSDAELPSDVWKMMDTVSEEQRPVAPARRGGVRAYSLDVLKRAPLERTELLNLDEALEPQPIPVPNVVLERWLVNAHAYTEEVAANVGLFGALFSGSTEVVRAGVIHEAKRYSIRHTETKRPVEIGVAVRLSVATTSYDAKVSLTIPNLAAQAQLSTANARVGITVIGYNGALGDLLPAPRKLDVETCVEYIQAFEKIQAIVFGEAGLPHLVPTVLSFDTEGKAGSDYRGRGGGMEKTPVIDEAAVASALVMADAGAAVPPARHAALVPAAVFVTQAGARLAAQGVDRLSPLAELWPGAADA